MSEQTANDSRRYWKAMYEDQLRRKRALHERFDGLRRSVADALDEALAEHEREPATDVWTSFWDRLSDGASIPKRQAGGRS